MTRSRLSGGEAWTHPDGVGHVRLYLGRGRMVHALQTGRNVEIVRLAGSNYGTRLIAARRVAVS
jgi:cell wall-associated NlpC family hydrolase